MNLCFVFFSLFERFCHIKTRTNISVRFSCFSAGSGVFGKRVDSKASQPVLRGVTAATDDGALVYHSTTRHPNDTENEPRHFASCLVPDGVLKTGGPKKTKKKKQRKKPYNSLLAFYRNTRTHTRTHAVPHLYNFLSALKQVCNLNV